MSDTGSQTISLITVHYRTEQKLLRLYESLKKFPPHIEWEWIIVDNHSGKDRFRVCVEAVAHDKRVHVVELQQNIGFGKGNMQGVQFAMGNYVAFINPDIEFCEPVFESLLSVLLSNPQNGIVTPLLETSDHVPLANTWKFPTFFSLLKKRFFHVKHVHPHRKDAFPVEWAQGSFLLMKKDFFMSVLNGFDDRFFLFLEDTDLCRRCWHAGYRVLQVPTVKAFHEQKRLSGEGVFRSMKKRTFWIHVRSVFQYLWKWKGTSRPSIF